MSSEFANTDLMGAYAGLSTTLSRWAWRACGSATSWSCARTDHSWGRGYRPGWLTVGTISTGQCAFFGHGPGPSTLLSGPADAFVIVDDQSANLA